MKGIVIKYAVFCFAAIALLLCSCAKGKSGAAADSSEVQAVFSAEMTQAFSNAGLQLLSRKVTPRDFSLPTLTGEQSLSALKGKIVFLNFWATWCGPCKAEMPSMEALYRKYSEKDFEIFAVNCGESREEVSAFMRENGLSFPAALDEGGRVNNAYGVQAIPTSFIIDKDGMIILRLVGSIDWNTPEIHAALEYLLNS